MFISASSWRPSVEDLSESYDRKEETLCGHCVFGLWSHWHFGFSWLQNGKKISWIVVLTQRNQMNLPSGLDKIFPNFKCWSELEKYINSGTHERYLENVQHGHLCLLCIETTRLFILQNLIEIRL